VRLATVTRIEDGMLHPGLGSSSLPSPARLEGASSAELEDGFHPRSRRKKRDTSPCEGRPWLSLALLPSKDDEDP
jgi:hypothetical protein